MTAFTAQVVYDEYQRPWNRGEDECGAHPGQRLYVDPEDGEQECPQCAGPEHFGYAEEYAGGGTTPPATGETS